MNDAPGEAGLWESRYQSGEDLFGAKPNAFFLEALQARPPGRLLLPGEGEGRNALAALRLGWEVCAFDLAPTARDRALDRAETQGKALTYELGALPKLPGAAAFSEPFEFIAVIDLPVDVALVPGGFKDTRVVEPQLIGIHAHPGFRGDIKVRPEAKENRARVNEVRLPLLL